MGRNRQGGVDEAEVAEFRALMRELLRDMNRTSRLHVEYFGLPSIELHVLVHLFNAEREGRRGAFARELAEELRLDKGALSRAVRSLEEKGLVARRADRADARLQHILLQERGRRLIAEADEFSQGFNREALASLSPQERATLFDGVRLLNRINAQFSASKQASGMRLRHAFVRGAATTPRKR